MNVRISITITRAILLFGILFFLCGKVTATTAASAAESYPVINGDRGFGGRTTTVMTRTLVVEDEKHPLYGRRVFWNGFDFVQDFVINFLQVNKSFLYRYKRDMHTQAASARTDVLVMSGSCGHCSAFPGLIVYIDGEAGKLQLKPSKTSKTNLLYLGVSQVTLPPDTTHIKLMYGVSALHYNSTFAEQAFRRNNINITEKTKFVAYAVSKCINQREKVFDALVGLSNTHHLGEVTAHGKCHGSAKNAFTHNSVSETAGARLNYVSNHILFKPYRFVLCMENSAVDHYMTEKIFNAYQAGAIPIYWGASVLVRNLFHPDSLVLVDPAQPGPALALVLRIERDPALYRRMLRTPILRHGHHSLKQYFAVDLPLAAAVDPGKQKHSLSNYIWTSILQRLEPLS
jgi:hypothetical protein